MNAYEFTDGPSAVLTPRISTAVPAILPLRLSVVALAFAALILGSAEHVCAQSYTVHALEPVIVNDVQYETFGKDVTADIGGLRLMVGYAVSPTDDNQPVAWTVESTGTSVAMLLDYPTQWFTGAVATSINNFGQIVGGGRLNDATGEERGLYWPNAAAAPLVLPGLTNESSCLVQQISDDGIIAGISYTATGSRAVVWRILADDTVVGPLVLPTRPRSSAGNDAALAVGSTTGKITAIVGRSAGAAVIWNVRTDGNNLTLDGSLEVLDSVGEATGIETAGAACGNDRSRSVVWGPISGRKRTKIQLSYNKSLFSSPGKPSALNDSGVVIGTANLTVNYAAPRAVLWAGPTAPMRTLESLTDGNFPFEYLESALAINGSADVVGYGWRGPVGGYQAFVAIPENQNP